MAPLLPTSSLSSYLWIATGRGVSRVGYKTAEAMVVRKGFSVEQLGACLDEYADLNVLQVTKVFSYPWTQHEIEQNDEFSGGWD